MRKENDKEYGKDKEEAAAGKRRPNVDDPLRGFERK